MTASTSRLTYEDCYKHFEKALADPVGIRIKATNYDSAVHLRSRLNYARKRDREENLLVYEPGHNLHGRSEYDPVMVTVKIVSGNWWVYMIRVDSIIYQVENLSGLENNPTDKGNYDKIKREEPKEINREKRRA